ncbi:MAG: hypothetical protein ACOCXF_02530 [bacterium]
MARFKCLSCGKTFSEQTFRLDYFAKRIGRMTGTLDKHDGVYWPL